MKILIKKFFIWLFKEELNEINHINSETKKQLKEFKRINIAMERIMKSMDVGLNVEYAPKYSKSWCVFSIQGEKEDFIKFMDLGDKELIELRKIIKQFEGTNIKIDAIPQTSRFLKI
jgi:hypothetical protein